MSLFQRHAKYLEEFLEIARADLSEELEYGGYGSLLDLTVEEVGDSVWAVARVSLHGQPKHWQRRRVVVPPDGPDKDAGFAAEIFATTLIEALDTRPWPPTD